MLILSELHCSILSVCHCKVDQWVNVSLSAAVKLDDIHVEEMADDWSVSLKYTERTFVVIRRNINKIELPRFTATVGNDFAEGVLPFPHINKERSALLCFVMFCYAVLAGDFCNWFCILFQSCSSQSHLGSQYPVVL